MSARGGSHLSSRDIAVIDVGSNSVRLVLYRVEGRAIWTAYNEKVLAGLGRGTARTGRLSPEGVTQAIAALKRFRAVLDGARPDEVFTAATAAVREAVDGPAFVERVLRETGLEIRVLSGEDEAHFAALGVAAGAVDAHGVVGDLGGSSLELTRLDHGRPGPGVTMALGPFSLGAPAPLDPVSVRAACTAAFARLGDRFHSETFYAVGGAWRNLALVHMAVTDYPLQIVHQFEMPAREALETARFVARQSRGSLERIPGVSKKRVETMGYAAVVLESVIETLGVRTVSVSAYGVREGLLLEAMAPADRALDPLVEGCYWLGARHGISERMGPPLEAWLKPLWSSLEPLFPAGRDNILLAAACRLCDLGARLHPDHRADLAFDQVLRAPIAGQSHAERAFLAAAVFSRYTAQNQTREGSGIARLLSPDRLRRARALGAALRLGCDLSGRSEVLLDQATLRLTGQGIELTVRRERADMVLGEQTRKRLAGLADVLELPSLIDVR
jgi:exopolyphosphatase/guanosine-5'-triphosphate,3'-diphosphate pyrophosphatase